MITAEDIQEIRNNDPGAILPGIDTMTGNPYATSSLLDVTKISNAPYYYSPSANIVYVTQAGAVLSGINFGSATVIIEANNVTIKDCTFTGTSSFWAITQSSGSGAIVENCTFTGSKSPTEKNIWISATQDITIEDNTFLNSPEDAIGIEQGLVTGNYFSGEGYNTAAHADAIYVPATTGPVTITDNFIDDTLNAGETGYSNTTLRITDEAGNNTYGVTVSGNYLIGAGFNFETAVTSNTNYTISNVSVTNNYLGFALYGPYLPGTEATISGNTTVDFTNPAASTQALAAYVAAGLPTANSWSVNGGSQGPGGPGPITTIGDGVASQHLGAGATETNFVGGAGQQVLFGGQGANILTYLAIGDGGDVATAFDPAKDVIDLSRIDGDIITPRVQNFTFIGSAAFSGGAQVRYQLNPTNGTTTVQAVLAGDTTADFTITLVGLRPLTAANFALTSAQSSAALANGAALSFTQVQTAAGAPTEYSYSNVQGRAYTSYESFYGVTYEDLAADDLNLSSNANKLVLYDPSQTVTRGGGSESLQVGTGSDPLAYHAVETIDATTSGGEQFIFSAGFGKETINGYNASGASPDSIKLAKSAFSYLTAGMTQAEDLAAVMSQSTKSASGLTIYDSHGDSLTLTGVTPSMVAANSSMLQFT
jgi:Right handed beta helix region